MGSMTGRELIIYIMKNHLEDVQFDYGIGLSDVTDVNGIAAKFGVGKDTIYAWYYMGRIKAIKVGETLLFDKKIADPREDKK